MKATILDRGLVTIIEMQLRAAQVSWLEIEPRQDINVGGHDFAIYSAALCNADGVVFDAWIVSGGPGGQFPYGGIYNQENYPDLESAVAQQIGQLALDGSIKLVGPQDGNKARKKKGSVPKVQG